MTSLLNVNKINKVCSSENKLYNLVYCKLSFFLFLLLLQYMWSLFVFYVHLYLHVLILNLKYQWTGLKWKQMNLKKKREENVKRALFTIGYSSFKMLWLTLNVTHLKMCFWFNVLHIKYLYNIIYYLLTPFQNLHFLIYDIKQSRMLPLKCNVY